jgi:hypothetical protein
MACFLPLLFAAFKDRRKDVFQTKEKMKEILEKLDKLVKELPDDCYFNDPASDEQIKVLESKYDIKLPGSFIQFLKHYNGGFVSLFRGRKDTDIDTLAWNSNYILAVELIDELFDKINYKTYGEEVKYIPILHTQIGEHLGFRYPLEAGGESKIYDLWHEASASEWADSVVYENFSALLEDYISRKGIIETM